MDRIEFLSKTLKFKRPPYILDVGANPLDKHLYTDLVESKLCNQFGFEPQKDAFDALVASKADNETYFNVAVGLQKTQTLHICKHSGITLLYKPDLDAAKIFPGFVNQMAVQQTFELSPIELDRVDGLPFQDMLKIDVQGAEKQIIQTGPKTLLDCVAIVIECRFARALAKRMVGRTGVLGQNKTELRALSSSELDQLADYVRDELRNHLCAFEG